MKDLLNPLEYGAPYQAILRDYYSKFQIKNYKTKPYFIIGNAENAILVQFLLTKLHQSSRLPRSVTNFKVRVFSAQKDSELVASENDFLASKLQKLFIYENAYSPDVFVRRLSISTKPNLNLHQIWQQLNILHCNQMKDTTILVIILQPYFNLTQDDLERTKMHLENEDVIMVFKDDKNRKMGFAASSRTACNDEEFLSRHHLSMEMESILLQKTPLEWLSWYKNMSGILFRTSDSGTRKLKRSVFS